MVRFKFSDLKKIKKLHILFISESSYPENLIILILAFIFFILNLIMVIKIQVK